MADQTLAKGNLRCEVDVDNIAIDLHIGFERSAALRNACIGHRDINAAFPSDSLCRCIGQRCIIAHIEGKDQRLAAIFRDFSKARLIAP